MIIFLQWHLQKRLASKFLGPFVITAKLFGLVYRLKLPKTLCIHDVFHISFLEPYHQDTIPRHKQTFLPPIVTLEGDLEWKVQNILDSQLIGWGENFTILLDGKVMSQKRIAGN